MVYVLEPELILVQANWSLSQTGYVFPQPGGTNNDVMMLHVVITTLKSNTVCPGVCADSTCFAAHYTRTGPAPDMR